MCDERVSYWISSDGQGNFGLDYFAVWREIETKCGNTAHDGSRAICETCAGDPRTMAEIERQESNIDADNAWARSAGWGEF